MKHFSTIAIVALVSVVVVSCATTKNNPEAVSNPEQKAAPPEQMAETPPSPPSEPKYVEIKEWKIQSVETAYPDGIVSEVIRYQYDDTGNLLKEEDYNANDFLTSQKIYTNQPDGTIGISTFNSTGDVIGKAIQEFQDNRLVSESLLNPKGEVQSREEYSYDTAGNKTKWMVRTAEGNQVTTEYIWEKGNPVRVVVRDAGQNVIKRYERFFDTSKLMQREEEYDSNGTMLQKTVYIYKEGYLVKEERQNPSGGILSSKEYINDADGNPTEIRYFDHAGRLMDVKHQVWLVFTRTIQER